MTLKQFLTVVVVLAFSLSGSAMGQTTATWIGPSGGSWADADNWDIGVVPNNSDTESYHVVIDRETNSPYQVGGEWNINIDSLTLDSEDATFAPGFNHRIEGVLEVIRGKLKIDGSFGSPRRFNAGEIKLNGNEIDVTNAIIERASVSDFLLFGNSLQFEKGASVTGNVSMRNGAISFYGEADEASSTTIGNANILLSNSTLWAREDVDVTLGADSVIRGYGTLGARRHTANFINEGRIEANRRDQQLNIDTGFAVVYSGQDTPELGRFVNRGTMRVSNGSLLSLSRSTSSSLRYGQFFNDVGGLILVEEDSELYLGRDWSSRGVLDVRPGGVLSINSAFTTADIKTVTPRVGSVIKVEALWDNEGATYTFGKRANAFEFGRATIRGGSVNFNAQPIKISNDLSFDDVEVRGDIVVNENNRVSFSQGRLFGDVVLNDLATFSTNGTNITNIGKVALNHQLTTFDVGSENEIVRWRPSQLIEGAGRILANNDGQSFRNYGTIRANVGDGVLAVSAASAADDAFLNRGLLEASDGGELLLGFSNGQFINGRNGVIRAKSDSTVTIFGGPGSFINAGVLELNDNSTLRFGGQYEQSYFTGISLSDSATISLEGQMTLGDDERFTPTRHFSFGDQSQVSGGTVDLSNINGIQDFSPRFESTLIDSDLDIGNGASTFLSGSTAVAGRTVVDGASLRTTDTVTLNGNLLVTNSGIASLGSDTQVVADVTVDGPESELVTSGTLGSFGSTITLQNEGTIRSRASRLTIGEGVLLTGNGSVQLDEEFSPFSTMDNQGTVEAFGNDGRIEIVAADTLLQRFYNTGVVSARDGGHISVLGTGLIQTVASARTILDGGSISSDKSFEMMNGSLIGNCTIESPFNVLYGGMLSPGLEVGQLNIIGDVYARDSIDLTAMKLVFDIAGDGQGTEQGYDFLNIDGDLQFGFPEGPDTDVLGAYLRIQTLDDVSIDELDGVDFSIIELSDSHELTGSFANVLSGGLLTTVDERFQFNVFYGADSSYGSNRVVLTNFSLFADSSLAAVPEPNALLLLAITSAFIAVRRKRA